MWSLVGRLQVKPLIVIRKRPFVAVDGTGRSGAQPASARQTAACALGRSGTSPGAIPGCAVANKIDPPGSAEGAGMAAQISPATPATKGEAKLLPLTSLAAGEVPPGVSLGLSDTQTVNGPKISTLVGCIPKREPKADDGCRCRELFAIPPTQITPSFSHGIIQSRSQVIGPIPSNASISRPSFGADAKSNMPLARRPAVNKLIAPPGNTANAAGMLLLKLMLII